MSENNNTKQNKSAGYMSSPPRTSIQSKYTVPVDFDKTPRTLQSLDHYLVNNDVCSLVQTLFDNMEDWSKWAKENKVDADCYFSPPYCREAISLGYE
jgi:hypothetical protein